MSEASSVPQPAAAVVMGVAPHAEAQPSPPPPATAPDPRVKKVIVAVHGVGDQYSFATLQSVVNQFCHFYQQPAALPLGSFHTGQVAFSIHPPYPKDPFERLAFSEVYWARFPRAVVDDQHTMEESKKWARTIVERLRMRWRATGSKGDCRDANFDMTKMVLEEMIETLAVIERLCFVADRAGLFTFDVRKLLEDYLGDVQIVAEFGSERRKILDAFAATLAGVHKAYPAAEIFIIAHSEGTVVSLLGMLAAGSAEVTPPWLARVRGFMTIGSPIDKHLILWPELFPKDAPRWCPPAGAEPIAWRNYYDRGDPIGFSLDDARAWLKATRWDQVFSFTVADDFGFDRYPFPGKAHVDYWADPAVFGHFIETVVKEPQAAPAPAAQFANPPRDIQWKKWLSYVVPYLLVAAILFVGVFILYKAVIAAVDPHDNATLPTSEILRSVTATTLLLLGITVATRILRLATNRKWLIGGFAIWALFAVAYTEILNSGPTSPLFRGWSEAGALLDLSIAFAGGMMVWLIAIVRPAWGLKPLILLGSAFVAFVIAENLYAAKSAGDIGPIWPVFLATVAFLYLWWLSALFFDLVFVWHHHIRQARALARLDEIIGTPWDHARANPTR
jgi:hypothetical protein